MVTLTTNEIYKMGHELSQSLITNKVTLKNELNIKVDDESFKKIDEDLYYRSNPNDDNFSPSQSKIKITFPCLEIFIYK